MKQKKLNPKSPKPPTVQVHTQVLESLGKETSRHLGADEVGGLPWVLRVSGFRVLGFRF